MSFLGAAWLVARKDLVVEARSRELAYTTVFFALACVLIFAFSFVREGRVLDGTAALTLAPGKILVALGQDQTRCHRGDKTKS